MTANLIREFRFMLRDRAVLAWLVFTLVLSSVAVWSGLREVSQQNASIESLLKADKEDREITLDRQSDWGDAAYYAFHLTYNPPTRFAFAALGQRDAAPWRHRIRMLALEGQIYENDTGNPEFALLGRFDIAFMAAFVLPLILIVMLHDARAGERTAGRYELLISVSGKTHTLWLTRAGLRAGAVCLCVLVPLMIGAAISGTPWRVSASAAAIVVAHATFWTLVCSWIGAWKQNASVILATAACIWIVFAVLAPVGGRLVVDRLIPVPSGAEIAMTQREAVNDAWDLPKSVTMDAFLEQHPEWAAQAAIAQPFAWKWYYAFQQVGDQKTKHLTDAYIEGRRKRDQLASMFAVLAPPALTDRALQRLAGTDMQATLTYEQAVRSFHRDLRLFHYPFLFSEAEFDRARLKELPTFKPTFADAR